MDIERTKHVLIFIRVYMNCPLLLIRKLSKEIEEAVLKNFPLADF